MICDDAQQSQDLGGPGYRSLPRPAKKEAGLEDGFKPTTRHNRASTLRRRRQGRVSVTNIETNIKNIEVRRLWSPSKENSNEWREEKLLLEEPIVLPPEEFSDHPRIAKTEEPIPKSSSRSANSTPLPGRRKKFSTNKRVSSRLGREETACLAAFQLLASRFPHVERLVTLFPGPETRTRVHVLQEILDLKNEALKDENADENILLLPPSENAHTFAELQGALLKRIQKMQEVSREEETELRLLWNSNMQECRQLEEELTKVAKTMEMDKFKLHLVEFGKMVSLLIGLSGRLVKVESALKSLNGMGLRSETSLRLERRSSNTSWKRLVLSRLQSIRGVFWFGTMLDRTSVRRNRTCLIGSSPREAVSWSGCEKHRSRLLVLFQLRF